jgi:hypothetical protein
MALSSSTHLVGTYRAKEAKQASRCSSLISCGILRSTEVAEVWLLKLLAELNHRRWFSATDINTDLGGAGACQLAARLRQGLAIRLWFGVRMATTSSRFGMG